MDNLVVSCEHPGFTNVSDAFIDDILGSLNESQVKIYLYLLRSVQGNIEISMTSIEDKFNYSEKDVIRAFKYLEKNRLIKINTDDNKNLRGLSLLEPVSSSGKESEPGSVSESESVSAAVNGSEPESSSGKSAKSAACREKGDPVSVKDAEFPKKASFSFDELENFKARPEICELLYVSETYLKRMLNETDVSSILYMNSVLGFPPALIEYLIEYCANSNKVKMSYIEKVALTWAREGIKSVEEAKKRTSDVPSETYEVLKAFGIKRRKPCDPETAYVKKWLNEYGFSLDIILLACERTIMNIHEPGFEYTDAILSNWKKSGVKSVSDIERLDEERQKEKEKAKGSAVKKSPKAGKKTAAKSSKTDYDALAKELLD
ncbi:MAG: DnaD domain protein [Lachnospiraceae bacterium]|nr:DnaD domain protein [Lachnospiraceae bacterium]